MTAVALVGSLCGTARAAATPTEVMPGVTISKTVEFTPHGAVALTVITGPNPVGLYSLGPAIARGTLAGGLDPVTQIEKDVSAQATVAGIDGDVFNVKGGSLSGIVMQGGVLTHPPVSSRSSIGVDTGGGLHVGRVKFFGTWRGTGPRRTLNGLNQQPVPGGVVLFTPAYGARAPAVAGAVQVVLEPFPASVPNANLTATVAAAGAGGGSAIPADGAVLLATGTAAKSLQAEATVGASLTLRLGLQPAWTGVAAALGGGPALLQGGAPIYRTGEDFTNVFQTTRTARAAVGQTADGHILLVAVDGNQLGYSVGLTNYELAQTMARLGAVTASALAGGEAATAAFDGQLLNRPSSPAGEQPVKEALLLSYAGVYAPQPPVAVVTGDEGASAQTLVYKVVRPSNVTAQLVAPDGTRTVVDSGARAAGTYTFTQSTFAAEGLWHWSVSATDDLGRPSTIDRTFRVDGTVRGLTAPRSARGSAAFRFTLARAASVRLQVSTPAGVVLRALPAQQLPAGPAAVDWDGRLPGGTLAYGGAYVAQLTVTSSVGTSVLAVPFTFRRS